MQTRVGRFLLVALLLAAWAGGAFVVWTNEAHRASVATETVARTAHLDTLLLTTARIGAAQEAALGGRLVTPPWSSRIETGIHDLSQGLSALRSEAWAPTTPARLDAVTATLATLQQATETVQENLRIGDTLMASDLVSSDIRNALEIIDGTLREVKTDEVAQRAGTSRALAEQSWMVIAAISVVWAIGLVVLASTARGRPAPAGTSVNAALPEIPEPPPVAASAPPEAAIETIDLFAVATLCTDLSRMTAAEALPELLGRAATILDASGLIIWMSAGDELFAATAYGYDPRVIGRLGSIGRMAENATAAAWRTGRLHTVTGDLVSKGAIVAPLFGPDVCIGVLAVEIPHGREHDVATRAVTVMVAAQLATALAAWPQASTPAPAAESTAAPSDLEG